jgi:enoyl-CoA hydratase/carnithine racemase
VSTAQATGVLCADARGVRTLTLNRPERRNALSRDLIAELHAALDAAGNDPDVRVVVLAANGPAFSAGHDLGELTGCSTADHAATFAACEQLMLALHALPLPVIARVEGLATAAGCQLVAACDLAVASAAARFATPGVRIGLFCTTPMVEVARTIGRKRAMEMLLTGEPIGAQMALDWGLVNRVEPPEEVVAATAELAERLTAYPRETLAFGKRAFYETLHLGLPDAYARASEVMVENAGVPAAQEGMSAFLQKREPRWERS